MTARVDLAMSEAQLQAAICELCRELGLLYYHTHDSRRSKPGFPDLVIVGRGGVLFAELKNKTHQATPEQQQWLERLVSAGAAAVLWRPEQWHDQTIAATLARLAKPRQVTS